MTPIAVAASALAICFCSVVVGQAVWRVAGFDGWSWLAGPVGLAALVTVCFFAVNLPGGAVTGAIVLALVTLGSLALVARDATRAAVLETAAAALLGLLVAALPFIAFGRVGILGVTDNADLSAHLMLADAVGTGHDPAGVPRDWWITYPAGPHSLLASLRTGLGIRLDAGFNGLLMATLALSVVTALALLRSVPPPRRLAGALVGGIPYLGASYTIQASFKETMLALMVVGWALALPAVARALPARQRAILPLAFLAAGAYGTYNFVGLAWPAAVTLACAATVPLRTGSLPRFRLSRRWAAAPAIFALVLAATAIPMIDQSRAITGAVKQTAAGDTSGGNIRAEVPAYEVFGAWPSSDLRSFGAGMSLMRAFALLGGLLALWAAWWWWKRGRRPELPAAAAALLGIYVVARVQATPYYSAKALTIASFAVVLMSACAVVLALPRLRDLRRLPPGRVVGALAGIAFLGVALWSSGLTLRAGRVAAAEHIDELESLRPLLTGKPTLYLGQASYLPWHLRGVPVSFPYAYINESQVPFAARDEKPWAIGQSFDFDNVSARELDRFRFVLGARTSFASVPPPNWHVVRSTRFYRVWERRGRTPARGTLPESGSPGALLDCLAPAGAALVRRGGTAGVMPLPVVIPPRRLRRLDGGRLGEVEYDYRGIAPGDSATIAIPLEAGRWSVALQYLSAVPVELSAAGSSLRVPPSMEAPGEFWPLGMIDAPGGTVRLTIRADDAPPLARPRVTALGTLALTRADESERTLPLAGACGRYVDWYRTG